MKASIVAARFAAFVGCIVELRVSWSPATPIVGELLGVVPAGRDYFVEVPVDGHHRMISTRAVLELGERPCE